MFRNKKTSLMIIIFSIITMVSTQFSNYVYGYDGLPSQIRIGLFFATTAKPFVSITSKSGFDIGYERDGTYINVMSLSGVGGLVIRKDGYFIGSGATTKEYSPDNGDDLQQPNRTGPYHVQFSGVFDNIDTAQIQIGYLKQKGLNVYPVFVNNTYRIWIGAYNNEDEAKNKVSEIQPLLTSTTCEVAAPNPTVIQVLKADSSDISFMYESSTYNLSVRPIAADNEVIPIGINTASYRGALEFKRVDAGNLTVINKVGLEEYLYGVLSKEMSGSWPLEALKAQAVSARTYAAYNMNKYQKNGFNLSDTDASQVYGGYGAEHPNCNKAVEETRGRVLTYKGKLAVTFFFSSSGGKTEDPKNVWGGSIPYLTGVDDPYEPTEKAGKGIWTVNITPQQVAEKLKAKGYDLGDILAVKALEYSPASRVTKLQITGTNGEKIFEKDSARTILGLNSQYYTISSSTPNYFVNSSMQSVKLVPGSTLKVLSASGEKVIDTTTTGIEVLSAQGSKKYVAGSDGYIFDGRGWGHGVGLSQWGAKGMADAGFAYDQILMHYYPGTELQ